MRASSFDEIIAPTPEDEGTSEAEAAKRRPVSLVERRHAHSAVDRPMPVADAASLLGGEEATDLGDRLRERHRARRMLLVRRIALTVVTLAVAGGALPVVDAAQAANLPEVRESLEKAIARANKAVSRAESIRRYRIVNAAFTVENGYMTPSLKLKRRRVLADYADEVDALYASGEAAKNQE